MRAQLDVRRALQAQRVVDLLAQAAPVCCLAEAGRDDIRSLGLDECFRAEGVAPEVGSDNWNCL